MNKKLPKIVAVIPAYNEAHIIESIIRVALKYTNSVIVIDNKSSNGTAERASDAGAAVFLEPKQGAGAATRKAWSNVRWDDYYDIMVTLNGDGQHDALEIPEVIAPILEGYADFVIGSRFIREHQIRPYRRFGIWVITFLYNFGSKHKLTDAQSCFRAYSRKVLESVNITEDGFAFSVETLIKARKKGLRIVEVPIGCHYHDKHSDNSTLNPIKHGLSVAWAVIKWRRRLHI